MKYNRSMGKMTTFRKPDGSHCHDFLNEEVFSPGERHHAIIEDTRASNFDDDNDLCSNSSIYRPKIGHILKIRNTNSHIYRRTSLNKNLAIRKVDFVTVPDPTEEMPFCLAEQARRHSDWNVMEVKCFITPTKTYDDMISSPMLSGDNYNPNASVVVD